MKRENSTKMPVGLQWLICLLPAFVSLTSAAQETCTVNASALNLRESPSSNAEIVGKLTEGDTAEWISTENGWAKIVHQGDTCYVAAQYITLSEEAEKAGLPAWANPEESKARWRTMGYYFSTDRIMEALPDFGLLRGELPFDPDICFHIAFWLLLLAGISFPFLRDSIEYGNIWYWIYYALTLIASACELLYLLASPDPLGFCDTNNVWFVTALFYLLLCGLALYQQLKLFSTILFVTQRDADFDFKAGLAPKLLLLAVIYFIVSIVAYHFGERFPEWLTYSVLGLLALPVLFMAYRAVAERHFSPLLLLIPFYCIAGAATLAVYCIIGITIAVLLLIWLIISLFGRDEMYVKVNGVWYWCDYDTWLEGMETGAWDDWSSQFHDWMKR